MEWKKGVCIVGSSCIVAMSILVVDVAIAVFVGICTCRCMHIDTLGIFKAAGGVFTLQDPAVL